MVKNNFSFEDTYALKIMAFEKDMASKGRRPSLPARQRQYENTAAAAEAQREAQKKARIAAYKSVLENIADGEAVNARTIADRIGTTSMKLINHMNRMATEGYLNRMKMANGKALTYVYSKTGKEMSCE